MEKIKEKNRKSINIKIAICLSMIFIFLILVIIFMTTKNRISHATILENKSQNIKISTASKIDINELIIQNLEAGVTEQILIENIEIEYITEYVKNENLPTGMIQVIQEGRMGIQQNTIKKTFENQIEISSEQLNSNIIKSPINKIVEIGTGRGKLSKYNPRIGDIVYVTSDRLTVHLEKSQQSQKTGTLIKNEEATILEVVDGWYKVKTRRVTGWVKSECTTNINPNNKQEDTTLEEKTATELIENLKFNMALNKPSGLSLEQFKKVLSDAKDKNNIFEENAEYFYYIEEQYNINGIFVAAVGIHESAWGTSKLAINKKNLFGYGASDSNPYNNAYNFDKYSESIDLLARVFAKYYLNPKGVNIYGGEIANGRYYNGNTLSAVNKRYASDSNWAKAVYSHMKYLYNKL